MLCPGGSDAADSDWRRVLYACGEVRIEATAHETTRRQAMGVAMAKPAVSGIMRYVGALDFIESAPCGPLS